MERYEVVWSEGFECLCQDCPQTCCRGWVIPLEDDDCRRLKKTKGKLGIELFFATAGYTRAKFNPGSRECPFHDRDGLCRLQKAKGHEFIPWTCQSYPRFYRNYGPFEESCLDLSCIGATRLFMKNLWNTETVRTEGEARTEICTSNDDRQYLQFLMDLRKEIMEITQKVFTGERSFGESSVLANCGRFVDELFSFSVMLQDISTRDEGKLREKTFNSFLDEQPQTEKPQYALPLPPSVFISILKSSLFHPRLRETSPELYRALAGSQKLIRRYSSDPFAWYDAAEKLCSDNPLMITVLGAYMSYYVFQYFLRAFETYSFRRQLALGIVHTNMILLLAMERAENRELSEEEIAGVIALYNRRAYFNDGIQDRMYRIFEDWKDMK